MNDQVDNNAVDELESELSPDNDEKLLEAVSEQSGKNLDVILNIPVQVSLELGRTKVDLRDLLQLSQGSVVELDRRVDEPMDVLVNGMLIAHAEVVVIDNKFGIRLTDVVSREKRVETFSG